MEENQTVDYLASLVCIPDMMLYNPSDSDFRIIIGLSIERKHDFYLIYI